MTAPEVGAKLENLGVEVITNTPEEFASTIKADVELFRRIVNAAGIKPE